MIHKFAHFRYTKQSTRLMTSFHRVGRHLPTLLCAFLLGCAQTQTNQSTSQPPKAAALVNGKPITQQQLWTHLAESNGQQILDELILTKLLDTAAAQHNWTVSEADQQHELDALIAVLDQSSDPQSTTPRLIESIRKSRGLGPTRFAALLRRNAILRRMVADDPNLQAQIQSQIQQATNQLNSEPTPQQAQRIKHRATLVAQQQAMEVVARQLVDQAEVLVMDRSINWSGE